MRLLCDSQAVSLSISETIGGVIPAINISVPQMNAMTVLRMLFPGNGSAMTNTRGNAWCWQGATGVDAG
jgi:hypothetical protein